MAESLGYDLITRLDENYIFLMQFVDRPLMEMVKEQQVLVEKWLIKLGTQVETQSIVAKLLRNSYITELIHQIRQRNLNHPFNTLPPQGELKPLDVESSDIIDHGDLPEWLDKLMADEANKAHVGGKNFETYLSTKLFPEGRGACAYLALSAQNEGDEAAWVKIRPNQHKDIIIDEMFQKELGKFIRQNDCE